MKTYKIYTLGCKVNQYDSNKLASELEPAGFAMAKKEADIAIVNSCVVTKALRAKILRQLGVKLAEDYKKKFKRRELEMVVEQIKQNKIIGKTEYYFEVGRKKIKNKNLKAGGDSQGKIFTLLNSTPR